jgi:hypothetical protein
LLYLGFSTNVVLCFKNKQSIIPNGFGFILGPTQHTTQLNNIIREDNSIWVFWN